MESGIPPLLPASPPPMSRDDFNEDEVDSDDYPNEDDDEFGNFSTAEPVNHSTKPSNHVNISCDNVTSSAYNISSSILIQNESFDLKPVSSRAVFEEVRSDEQNPMIEQPMSQLETDELKISSDKIICSRGSMPDESFSIPLTDSNLPSLLRVNDDHTNLNLSCETIFVENTDSLKNLPHYQQSLPLKDVEPVNSPSLSDSDSIDVPDDSFIICEEICPKHEPNDFALSENNGIIDSTFTEFHESESSVFSNPKNHVMQPKLFTKVLGEKAQLVDTVLCDQNFYSETPSSDGRFQPVIDVSASLPSEEVTDLDFSDVFGSGVADQSQDHLAGSTEKTENENQLKEIVSTPFSSVIDTADDDDFSDFVSPTTCMSNEKILENKCDQEPNQYDKSREVPISTHISDDDDFGFGEMCSFEQDSSLASQTLNWTEIFCAPAENHIEVNVNTIEGKLKCSSVWCKIKDIETSPALHYNWNDSDTNKLLLATLCVDSRNILFGPRWSSEVPRFASNLGFTPLVPQKASEKSPLNCDEFPDLPTDASPECATPFPEQNATISTVPDAHFDWNNSGLTNPLDCCKQEKNTVTESYELQNSLSMLNGSETKTLSAEATNILNSLPDLVVMEKQYIVFPIR